MVDGTHRKKLSLVNSAKELASLGGQARAAALSAEERSAAAKKAADERWAREAGIPKETHPGNLEFGGVVLPCAVLENGTRVLSRIGLIRAFGSKKKGLNEPPGEDAPRLPPFLASPAIRSRLSEELQAKIGAPLVYRPKGGGRAFGYEATLIPQMCEAILDARAAGRLTMQQLPVARMAEALLRGFARVGIIALIDEATGYQADRARDELQRLLEAFVAEEMRPWVKLFPDRFFQQVYRLHGWKYEAGVTQGPRYVGRFINEYVYKRLPPEVLEELRRRNPVVNSKGQRRYKHFQFLTDDIGHPAIDRHLASVTTLMTVSTDKDHFREMFAVAFPAVGQTLRISETVQPPALPPKSED